MRTAIKWTLMFHAVLFWIGSAVTALKTTSDTKYITVYYAFLACLGIWAIIDAIESNNKKLK